MVDQRIHDCLDGLIPREALSADELQRLDAFEASLNDAALVLRRTPAPDLTAGVMREILAAEGSAVPVLAAPGPLARAARWLWAPLRISVRPAYALASLALLLGAVLLAPPIPGGSSGVPIVSAGNEDAHLYVQFRIEVPGASQVAVAGTFSGWRADHQLTEVSPGVWSALVPLDPGVHDYTFVIDGERMVVDPYAPRVADSFGGSNSRLFLPAPNGSA